MWFLAFAAIYARYLFWHSEAENAFWRTNTLSILDYFPYEVNIVIKRLLITIMDTTIIQVFEPVEISVFAFAAICAVKDWPTSALSNRSTHIGWHKKQNKIFRIVFAAFHHGYNLYFCSKGGGFSEYYDEVYDLKWPTDSAIGKFYAKYKDVLSSRIPREKGWLLSESLTAVRLLNMLMIPELRRKKYIEMAMELNSKMPSGKGTKEEKLALCNETEQKIREELTKIAEDKSNYIPLAESLMLTFCEADSKLLFPYDRAGQYAAIAEKLGLNWVSLYKASCSIDAAYYFQKSMERYADVEKATQMTSRLYGKDHVDYLEGINPEHYEERITIPDHKPVQYDSNYLSIFGQGCQRIKKQVFKSLWYSER